ncbi:MAG: hypothetical protein IKL28_03190 [Lachnospiraceae bacterium]|nr:hypothetical protein [Lachnospiraceae bacterium]
MIVWYEKMYIGEQAEKSFKKIRKKLENRKPVFGFFLITKPSNQQNLFDILPTKELLFPYYKRQELLVYGLAKGKEEAENLVVSMLEDVYRETGGLCCKEYFKAE